MLPGIVISTILKHDAKVTSYKFALLRAINDVAISFPDLRNYQTDIAIPLRVLAEFWVAYYWPFVHPDRPIWQGQRSYQGDKLRNDMSFRPQLSAFREQWEQAIGGLSNSSDGFYIINELRVLRRRAAYPHKLLNSYTQALSAIAKALEMPIRHAGPGEWQVFAKPVCYSELSGQVVAIPGTQRQDKCLVIAAELWQTFQEMSLWVEALCIHEWCLFTESVQQNTETTDRGLVYKLLTARPDNRRPLTWERNEVDLLLLEGTEFICPWTEKRINRNISYDLDHLLPVSVYPINELWNLVPADPKFNSHTKRDRLPTVERLLQAKPYIELAYSRYIESGALSRALREDVGVRFFSVQPDAINFPTVVAGAVVDLIDLVAESRNLARF